MSWLSKATGIHIGGGWGISKKINSTWSGPLAFASNFYKGAKDRYQNFYAKPTNGGGLVSGIKASDVEAAAKAAAAAAKKRAHDEEVAALGAGSAEAARIKRRRGLYATILTGSGPPMGSPAASSGKSTLGA